MVTDDLTSRIPLQELMELAPYMRTQYLLNLRQELCDLIDGRYAVKLFRLKLAYINAELARRVPQS